MNLRIKTIALARLGAAFALIMVRAQQQTPPQQAYPFQDPKLPAELRVNNIVSLMTVEEKIGARATPKGCTGWRWGAWRMGPADACLSTGMND
jgi:hypothetical protein